MSNILVNVKNLYVEYVSQKNILNNAEIIHAVNGVDLNINRGEILAIAGESGCGKSTLAKAMLQLIPVKSGEIIFDGTAILALKTLKEFRKKVQMIFQNPYASLNPKMKIKDILKEPLIINTKLSKIEINKLIKKTVGAVGLDDDCLNLYPHEFSGGQRQRIAIARALILNPEFIVADEPVSALDVSIQAQIINLLKELKEKYNLTFLFISHDLSVIKYISDRVAVMYLGEIVEQGTTDEIFNNPQHPYTKALLNAVPKTDNSGERKVILEGDLPSPANIPGGCKFHTRCHYCMDKCCFNVPPNISMSNTHYVKCFLNEQ